MVKILAGGRFNFFHSGHRYFLEKAKEHGDELVVVVAHDKHNKKRDLREPMEKRLENIKASGIADKVVPGKAGDFFTTVLEQRPDIIALGWDQELPMESIRIRELGIKVVKIGKLNR